MKIRAALLAAILFLLCGAAFAWMILRPDPALAVDAVAVNRIVRGVETNWDALDEADFLQSPYDFCVLDTGGMPVYQKGDAAQSVWEAVQRGDIILDAGPPGRPLGKVLVSISVTQRVRASERRLAALVFLTFLGCALLTAVYFLYLRCRVYMPFQRLRAFAVRVASGNLEAPLQMEQENLFGAFTESFDLMREELRRARARELAAQQEKKELVASLSHDIRTPVTSIKLLCELMQATAPAGFAGKLETIQAKADCIDGLITNLFHATLEELGELRVNPVEWDSRAFGKMLQEADYLERVQQPCPVPACILRADPLRMEQVLANLFANSYKYAGTSIEVSCVLSDEFLSVTVRDFGSGAAEDELPSLTQKFYRGRNTLANGRDGSGLGLYLARYLMEKIGGDLTCRNARPGFAVELLIPLA